VTEQVFRYNNRATKDNPLNDATALRWQYRRFRERDWTYAELTGKVGETEAF